MKLLNNISTKISDSKWMQKWKSSKIYQKIHPKTLAFHQKYKSNYYLLLCFFVPALIMFLMYMAREVHPFGDSSVLVLDLNAQYVWFFEALRNAMKGEASLLYSFSRALGGEFTGIYAYYLASPLSYLVCLFPEDAMQNALYFLFVLKVGLCGTTFGYYMHKTLPKRNALSIIVFSTFYALSAYAVVQQHNTMWIDAVAWLPLIALGMEMLIKEGKFILYTAFLSLTVFSNFYIGYMVCIFCFLYFFLYYFAHSERHKNNPFGEKLHFLKSLGRVAFFSILALGIASVLIGGAFYALNMGKTTFSNPNWEWGSKFPIIEYLYKFLPGSYDTVRPAGLPFVYCGVLTILLFPLFFFTKRHSIMQKIAAGLFILLLTLSMMLTVTDLIWHGFQKPNWLNYRYSFILCFYLCVLACRALADFSVFTLKGALVSAGFLGILLVILQNYKSESEYVQVKFFANILLTIGLIVFYLALLALLKRMSNKRLAGVFLVTLVSIEVLANGLLNLNSLDEDVTYTHYSYYNNFLDKTRPIVEEVQEKDTTFYRMEKTFFRKTNDNMALNIRGLSGSTSTLNKETIKFLNKMGYSSKSHWSKYLGGTPVNDSLLGLKYIITDSGKLDQYYETFAVDEENGYTAYYNPYALSIAYGVDDALLDIQMGFVPDEETEDSDEEEKGAAVVKDVVSYVKGILQKVLDIDEEAYSTYEDAYNSPFTRLNAIITAMLGEDETIQVFVPISISDTETSNLRKSFFSGGEHGYTSVDSSYYGSLSYTITMPEDAELFFYLPTNYAREVKLNITNSETSKSAGTFNANETGRIISLGNQTKDDEVTLKMTLTTTWLYMISNEDCFYYIDWDVFEDVMARLAQDELNVTDYTESKIEGTLTTSKEHELVMTTIAYDKGWNVYVDGKKVETTKALGSVVAFYVDGEAGETHNITLRYWPKYLTITLIVCLNSLAFFIFLIVLYKKKVQWKFVRSVIGIPHEEEIINTCINGYTDEDLQEIENEEKQFEESQPESDTLWDEDETHAPDAENLENTTVEVEDVTIVSTDVTEEMTQDSEEEKNTQE